MSDKIREEIKAFKATVEEKLERTLSDFSKGKLSREQFQIIYERYNSQLNMAEEALQTGNIDLVYSSRNAMSTVAVKNAYEGKALGLMTYHYGSGTFLETLGNFDLPEDFVKPMLQRFRAVVAENKFVDRHVEHLSERQWIMYSPGRYTAVVTLFHNEPSEVQIGKIEQLHRDFEKANQPILAGDDEIEPAKLAYPFTVFVQKKKK